MTTVLVDPSAIPGTKMDLSLVETAATSMTSMGSTVRTEGGNAVSHWAAMSGVYEAPESGQLLAVMDPVNTDATTVGDDLEAIGGALSTFATEAEPIHQRLKQLKTDAEEFVTRANAGVTLYYGDIYYSRVNPAVNQPGFVPVSEPPPMHCEWDNYPPYVEENQQLIIDIAKQVELMDAAAVECANSIIAANSYVCRPSHQTSGDLSTLAENGAEMPWGTAGKGDRTCAEGAWDAGVESVEGIGMLFGYNPMIDDWGDGAVALEAWKGLGMGLLGTVTMTSPASYGIQMLPDDILPGLQTFMADANEAGFANITGFTGTAEDWSSDPDAAMGALMFNVGGSLIPGGGLAVGAVKIASIGGRSALRGLDVDVPNTRINVPDADGTPSLNLPSGKGIDLDGAGTRIDGIDIHIDVDGPNVRPDGPDAPNVHPDGADAPNVPSDGPDAPNIPADAPEVPSDRPDAPTDGPDAPSDTTASTGADSTPPMTIDLDSIPVEKTPSTPDWPEPTQRVEITDLGSRTAFPGKNIELEPNTAYDVQGRGTYYTDETGTVTHVDAEAKGNYSRTEVDENGDPVINQTLNYDLQHPAPNTIYQVESTTYRTDSAGRTEHVHIDGLDMSHSGARSESVQQRIGHEGDQYYEVDGETIHVRKYDGGHLHGTGQGGIPEDINVIPMLSELNRSSGADGGFNFYSLEQQWRDTLAKDPDADIQIDFDLTYDSALQQANHLGSTVPTEITVTTRVNGGMPTQEVFYNVNVIE